MEDLEKIKRIKNNCFGISGKTNWMRLPVIAAAFALGFSYYIGADAAKSCLWALIVSVVAGSVSFAPVIYAVRVKSPSLIGPVLSLTVIRLLTMVVGFAIVTVFADVNVTWFVVWLCLFYIVISVMEACFVVRILKTTQQN